MRKILLFISLFLFFIIPVKADTIINIQYGGSNNSEYYYLNNLPFDSYSYSTYGGTITDGVCSSKDNCYNTILSAFSSSNKQYYSIYLSINPSSSTPHISMNAYFFDFSSNDTYTQDVFSSGGGNINRFKFYKGSADTHILALVLDGWSDPNTNNFYLYYDGNFNFINNNGDYIFEGFYDNEDNNYNNMLHISNGESIPKIKDLLLYNSWSDYINNHIPNYSTVNLDDYSYIILSLKSYSNISPFQTNLQVKGQIGITPVYNFGQSSKDSITGSQVQDRCNVSYTNFTSYPFYIIQSDITNNVVYYVKECTSGSEFKYDTSIFDITYITDSNIDNPTITINGHTYNTIPYSDLPSTATKNEEDNYIPGQSGSAVDTGGLDSAIKGVQQGLSTLWNTFTYFTDFVGLIFSSLPVELRTILLSAFVVAITIGLIKLFTS